MKFGICVPVEQSSIVKAAGFDFVEEVVPRLLQGDVPDDQWSGAKRVSSAVLPVPAANALVPGSLKITGPDVSADKLREYIERIVDRAATVGIKILVFGSGVARNVPEGFDRKDARRQILDFLRMALPYCARHGILVVCEPLNRGECNIINSVAEAMEYVWQIDHPHFQCLVDSYHLWLENEPLEHVRDAMPWIRHVHLSDTEGRRPPGLTGKNDYRPLFAELKRGNYDGVLTIETIGYAPILEEAPQALQFLKKQWAEA
jgi:sugar phosphate isomerase/epimerase